MNFEEEDATAILEGILKPVLFIVRKRVEPNDEVMNESLRTFVVDLIGFITSARRVTLSTFNEFNTLYRRLKINLPLVFEDLQDVNYPQKRVINANYILEQLIKRTFFEVEVRFERAEM